MLRVVGTSPDVFCEEIQHVDGMFDELVREISAKRVLVDSATLLGQIYGNEFKARTRFNAVNNGIKRARLTGLFTMEISGEETNSQFLIMEKGVTLGGSSC